MLKGKKSGELDLSGVDVRVRRVLGRLGVGTIDKLLALREEELSGLKNCVHSTTAKILQLQAEYKKGIPSAKPSQINYPATESGKMYLRKLIIAAIAAKGVIAGAEKIEHNRYYFRVPVRRVNVLRRTLEELEK